MKLLILKPRRNKAIDKEPIIRNLYDNLHRTINKTRGRTSYAAVVGVLESVKIDMIEESRNSDE